MYHQIQSQSIHQNFTFFLLIGFDIGFVSNEHSVIDNLNLARHEYFVFLSKIVALGANFNVKPNFLRIIPRFGWSSSWGVNGWQKAYYFSITVFSWFFVVFVVLSRMTNNFLWLFATIFFYRQVLHLCTANKIAVASHFSIIHAIIHPTYDFALRVASVNRSMLASPPPQHSARSTLIFSCVKYFFGKGTHAYEINLYKLACTLSIPDWSEHTKKNVDSFVDAQK